MSDTGRRLPRVACLMMQKDELGLLEAWLRHHGSLFGYENLFIFDNGSVSPVVREVLERFEPAGINVDYGHATRESYRDRPDIFAAAIATLERAGRHDFFLLLDCDEFVAKKTPYGVTVQRREILDYLATLAGEPRVLQVPYQFANHPRIPDLFVFFDFFKVFFAAGAFAGVDHGNHVGVSRAGADVLATKLVHLHFHHRSYDVLLELARRKWRGPENLAEVAEGYTGQSGHLPRYFRMGREAYYGQFASAPLFYFPAFRRHLGELGARIDLSVAVDADGRHMKSADEPMLGWSDPPLFGPLADTGEQSRMTLFVPTELNEDHYRAANEDLQTTALRPMAHFCRYGFKEIRPREPPA